MLRLFLNFGKQLFFSSIRNLKDIFVLSLIMFPKTATMITFLLGMSDFARQDIWNGEAYYEKWFTFVDTDAKNA